MKSPMKPKPEKDLEGAKELPTFVYVAIADGRTKIGIAGNVELRVRQLRNGSGVVVRLVASRQFSSRLSAEYVEGRLHRRFHGARLHGEWFSTDPGKVVDALAIEVDPELHTDYWAPGMPSEVAMGDAFERWRWLRDNSMLRLSEFTAIWGKVEGRKRFLAQVPGPPMTLGEERRIHKQADKTMTEWRERKAKRAANKAAKALQQHFPSGTHRHS